MKTFMVPMDTASSAHFTQTVNLSGTTFSMRFIYNERDGFFYMDVSTSDGERKGVRLVPNTPLLGDSDVTSLGDFYLLSEDSGAAEYPERYEDYGTKWNLYWIPNDQEEEE